MAKIGRKPIEIDKSEFEKLCALHCTQEEIAGFFDCSADTIDRWCKRTYKENFAEVFKQKRSAGRISLRRTQFAMAQTNATMAIWLGKQWLKQAEQQEINVSINDDETIKEMEKYFESKQEENS
jgi:hypothetical protein